MFTAKIASPSGGGVGHGVILGNYNEEVGVGHGKARFADGFPLQVGSGLSDWASGEQGSRSLGKEGDSSQGL